MGTEVHLENYLSGYYSMRDFNEDSNSCSWPLHYKDKSVTNGQYFNGFLPQSMVDPYLGYDKNVVKRMMLEHEAVFRNQVFELHRLYKIQRDLMEEINMKQLNHNRIHNETSLSSSTFVPQDSRKWNIPSFPTADHGCTRPSISNAEENYSPLSSLRGSSTKAGPFRSPNGDIDKDIEILETRPTKVRRKLIDLRLPADDYIDIDGTEQSSYRANGKGASSQGDALKSGSYLRKKNALADLNEPIQIEETNAVYSTSQHETCGGKAQILGLPKERHVNTHYGSNDVALSNPYLMENGCGGGQFSRAVGTGLDKNSQKSFAQVLRPEELPFSFQPVKPFNNVHELPAFPIGDPRKVNLWSRGLESTSRNQEYTYNNNLVNGPTSYPTNSPDFLVSWNHFRMRENLNNSLEQKPVSVQTGSFVNSSQSIGNCSRPLEATINRVSIANAVNLNASSFDVEAPKKNIETLYVARKNEYLTALPWLRAKPSCSNKTSEVQRNPIVSDLNLPGLSPSKFADKNPNGSKCISSCTNVEDCRTNGKILGFPIFDKPCENGSSSVIIPFVPTPPSSEAEVRKMTHRLLDINLPCDSIPPVMQVIDAKVSGSRHYIDLNSCMSEEEEQEVYFAPCSKTNVKITSGINLEAFPPSETEEEDILIEESPKPVEAFARIAAEAIIDMSLSDQYISYTNEATSISPVAKLTDPLGWFADTIQKLETISISENERESSKSSSDELDYFECMTLKLTRTTEKDVYIPTPLDPQNLKLEGTGGGAPARSSMRPRRGHARRGRQRRDFQRDILPGLVSLSRHEVTEDFQTFDGLMRASGHSFSSGLTRKNGCSRGRKRSVSCVPLVQQTTTEIVGVEDRSLTGWGKTTRRPRRQRCPSGNLSSASPLT